MRPGGSKGTKSSSSTTTAAGADGHGSDYDPEELYEDYLAYVKKWNDDHIFGGTKIGYEFLNFILILLGFITFVGSVSHVYGVIQDRKV